MKKYKPSNGENMELIDVKPVKLQKSIAHLHLGENNHVWKEIDFPVYPKYPIGEKIRKYRQKYNITLGKAARMLGLSLSELSGLETGSKNLKSDSDVIVIIKRLSKGMKYETKKD